MYYLQYTAFGRPDTINGDKMLKYYTDDDGVSDVAHRRWRVTIIIRR